MKFSYCRHRHSRPQADAPALELEAIDVVYPGGRELALRSLSLQVQPGSSMALVGANGAGKSTLFKAVAGLLPVRKGRVRVFGRPLGACHHRVAYLPQRPRIDWQFPMSVMDLVLTGRYVSLGWFRNPASSDRTRAQEALRSMGVDDLAQRQISCLSGGQQQRVLIARALVQQADLLLLDEPLNAVDAQTRKIVADCLERLKLQGRTVITATHHYREEEGQYDGAIFLKDGERVSAGPQHEEGCCS